MLRLKAETLTRRARHLASRTRKPPASRKD